jgi:RimJ/RimL family protein N-acetyltransferase
VVQSRALQLDDEVWPVLFADRLPVHRKPVLLRLLRPADVEAFLAYRSDPEVARYQGWSTMDRAAASEFLEDMSGVDGLRPGEWIQLGIADAATGTLCGDVGIHCDEALERAEIGFSVARPFQGRGYASAAVSATLDLLQAVPSIRCVRGVTDARNGPSIRLLERLGFAKTGVQVADFKGERCAEYVYERAC